MIVACDLSGCWGAEVHHQHIERNPLREFQRPIRFPDGRLAPFPVVHGVRVVRRPLIPAPEEIGDRRMDAVERQPGFREPLLQEVDRRFVPIVEMTPRGKELDRLEAVSRHLRQVVPLETAVVIEVRGNAETHRPLSRLQGSINRSIVPRSRAVKAPRYAPRYKLSNRSDPPPPLNSSTCADSSSRRRPNLGRCSRLSRTYRSVRGMYWM